LLVKQSFFLATNFDQHHLLNVCSLLRCIPQPSCRRGARCDVQVFEKKLVMFDLNVKSCVGLEYKVIRRMTRLARSCGN